MSSPDYFLVFGVMTCVSALCHCGELCLYTTIAASHWLFPVLAASSSMSPVQLSLINLASIA
jgi:hypothetical protein